MKKLGILTLLLCLCFIGCGVREKKEENISSQLENEMDLVKLNEGKKPLEEGDERVVVTSVAISEITALLDIHLVGAPYTKSPYFPTQYENTPRIGLPMNPDMEVLAKLEPSLVYGPENLRNWTEEGLKKIGVHYEFLPMSSVDQMYEAIQILGSKFGKEDKALEVLKEHKEFMDKYQSKTKAPKKVLILMGLPGSYMVATEKSYVGDLLKMSGAENVLDYEGEEEFLQVNPEVLLKLDPDVILRASHALPEDVSEMFSKEFETNQIWKHFRAVKEGKVYDLNPDYFGMSCNFRYKDALLELDRLIYE